MLARVVMSAADTLTFQELNTGVSLGQNLGILIDEIDYYVTQPNIGLMSADSDRISIALTSDNTPSAIHSDDMSDRRIIDSYHLGTRVVGAIVSQGFLEYPVRHQFFPPIIIASPQLYVGMETAGLASAGNAVVRILYRFIPLSAQDYLELAETFLLTS